MNNPHVNIYAIRHAQSQANTQPSIINGRSNEVPLSTLGESQARRLGVSLLHEGLRPDAVFSSPALRCLETARLALRAARVPIEPTIDDRLQEIDMGEWTGQNRLQVYANPLTLATIIAGGRDFKAPGGESSNEVGARVLEAFNEMADAAPQNGAVHTIFVFMHGFAIRCAAATIKDLPQKQILLDQDKTPNASRTLFTRDADRLWDFQYEIKV